MVFRMGRGDFLRIKLVTCYVRHLPLDIRRSMAHVMFCRNRSQVREPLLYKVRKSFNGRKFIGHNGDIGLSKTSSIIKVNKIA